MKRMNALTKVMVALATFGMILPVGSLRADDVRQQSATLQSPAQQPAVVDVALGQGNVLKGQFVTVQGVPKAKAAVALQAQDGKTVNVVTNDKGLFEVKNVRAGLYTVSTGDAQLAYRMWAPNTAPPAANNGVLLVDDGSTVRGAAALGGLGGLGIGGLIIIGTAIAIGVAAATNNDASD